TTVLGTPARTLETAAFTFTPRSATLASAAEPHREHGGAGRPRPHRLTRPRTPSHHPRDRPGRAPPGRGTAVPLTAPSGPTGPDCRWTAGQWGP
ncbi:hypothetical protein ABTZ17_36645, partial [Streptomyces sp. NPDC097619]